MDCVGRNSRERGRASVMYRVHIQSEEGTDIRDDKRGGDYSIRANEARFPDKYGNVCVRHVMRPDVIANYFRFSNVVDVHNQARQYELALKKNG